MHPIDPQAAQVRLVDTLRRRVLARCSLLRRLRGANCSDISTDRRMSGICGPIPAWGEADTPSLHPPPHLRAPRLGEGGSPGEAWPPTLLPTPGGWVCALGRGPHSCPRLRGSGGRPHSPWHRPGPRAQGRPGWRDVLRGGRVRVRAGLSPVGRDTGSRTQGMPTTTSETSPPDTLEVTFDPRSRGAPSPTVPTGFLSSLLFVSSSRKDMFLLVFGA